MARMRMRTVKRAGMVPGQPERVVTDPESIPRRGNPRGHVCGECFGPRSAYRKCPFCSDCERKLFGGRNGYQHFVISERARSGWRTRKQRQPERH